MNLKNKWMNDPEYLAQVSHFLGGYAAIVSAKILWGAKGVAYTFMIGLILAAIKEFWYDAKYEIPKQTFMDNLIDFIFYFLGGMLGLIVTG